MTVRDVPSEAPAPLNPHEAQPPARGTLVLFSAGDFAFNLYWQAISLYLLFFYMDALALPPATAGLIFMIGAIWDGAADFLAGAAAERMRLSYRRLGGRGAPPYHHEQLLPRYAGVRDMDRDRDRVRGEG